MCACIRRTKREVVWVGGGRTESTFTQSEGTYCKISISWLNSTDLSDELPLLYLFKVTWLSKYIGWGSNTLLPNMILAFQKKKKTTLIFHFYPQSKSVKLEKKLWHFPEGDKKTVIWEVSICWLWQKGMPFSLKTERTEMKMMKMTFLLYSCPSQLDPTPWHRVTFVLAVFTNPEHARKHEGF